LILVFFIHTKHEVDETFNEVAIDNDMRPKKKLMIIDNVFPPLSYYDFRAEVLKMAETPDITLISQEDEKFMCHSSKLGINEYFKRLFDSSNPFMESETREVHLPDVSSEVLNEFLNFMYNGQLSQACKTPDIIRGLLHLSEKYLMYELKQLSLLLLLDDLQYSNALQYLLLAHTYNMPSLADACLQTIAYDVKSLKYDSAMYKHMLDSPDLLSLVITGLANRAAESSGIVAIH